MLQTERGEGGEVLATLTVRQDGRVARRGAVRRLRDFGLTPVVTTSERPEQSDEVGIDHVVAEVLPAGKVAAVRALQDVAAIPPQLPGC